MLRLVFAVLLLMLPTCAHAFEWLGYRSGMTVAEASEVEGTPLHPVRTPTADPKTFAVVGGGDVVLYFCHDRLQTVSHAEGKGIEQFLAMIETANEKYGKISRANTWSEANYSGLAVLWQVGEHDIFSVNAHFKKESVFTSRIFSDESNKCPQQ